MTYELECAMCGRNGGPYDACQTCSGRGGTQRAAFTLSQERRGEKSDPDRYGPDGSVGPHRANDPLWAGAQKINE